MSIKLVLLASSLLAFGCGNKSETSNTPAPSNKTTETAPAADKDKDTAPAAARTAETPTRSATAASLPKPLEILENGVEYNVVYVYVGKDQAKIDAAIKALEGAGLVRGTSFWVQDAMTDGVVGALNVPQDATTVGAYFKKESDAKAFAAAMPAGTIVIKNTLESAD